MSCRTIYIVDVLKLWGLWCTCIHHVLLFLWCKSIQLMWIFCHKLNSIQRTSGVSQHTVTSWTSYSQTTAASDVGIYGLLASQSCYHSMLVPCWFTLWTSGSLRFLHHYILLISIEIFLIYLYKYEFLFAKYANLKCIINCGLRVDLCSSMDRTNEQTNWWTTNQVP